MANGCELGAHAKDMHSSSVIFGLQAARDNSTYEAELFGDRAVELINQHSAQPGPPPPLFLYQAFHNEHDPHQAPLDALSDDLVGHIKTDVYKVTAALINAMDVQVGRIVDALNSTDTLSNCVIGFSR